MSLIKDGEAVVAKWNACKMCTNVRECVVLNKAFKDKHGGALESDEHMLVWQKIAVARSRKYKAFHMQSYRQFLSKLTWDNKPMYPHKPVRLPRYY